MSQLVKEPFKHWFCLNCGHIAHDIEVVKFHEKVHKHKFEKRSCGHE